MSMLGRFFLITVKEFFHKSQPGVGSGQKKGPNLVTVVKECPLTSFVLDILFVAFIAKVAFLMGSMCSPTGKTGRAIFTFIRFFSSMNINMIF